MTFGLDGENPGRICFEDEESVKLSRRLKKVGGEGGEDMEE